MKPKQSAFYVAMTRAEERLVLVGSDEVLDDEIDKCLTRDPEQYFRNANRSLDWILGVALRSPAGQAFLAGRERPSSEDASQDRPPFRITSCTYSALRKKREGEQRGAQLRRLLEMPREECEDSRIVEGVLSFRYPYEEDTLLPYKKTVTELAKEREEGEWPRWEGLEEWKPSFGDGREPAFLAQERKPTALRLGTLTHRVMQTIPLSLHTVETVEAHLADMIERELILPEEAERIPVENVAAFFATSLAERLVSAKETALREIPFTFKLDTILVDGKIDCCFEEENRWILLDFKTDRLVDEEKYRAQMDLYARALEEATGKPVSERHLVWINARRTTRMKEENA